MSLYLDIFTAVVLLICVFAGYWRGIFKYTVLLLTSLLAVVVSLVFTQLTTDNVYDRFVRSRISMGRMRLPARCRMCSSACPSMPSLCVSDWLKSAMKSAISAEMGCLMSER